MNASRQPMTAKEAVEVLEKAGYELSASGYFPFRYFLPRTVTMGIDLRHVDNMPEFLAGIETSLQHTTQEERGERELVQLAEKADIWPYLHRRGKRRRKRNRIIRKLIWAQAAMAHCRKGTWAYAAIQKVVDMCNAALLALGEGGAQ